MEFRVIRSSQFSDEKPRNVKGLYKKDKYWYVQINTLEELIEFYKKHTDLIIQENWDNKEEMMIEIYDDYRE